MEILCCIVLVVTGRAIATVQPKSVNLALETVLQFDKHNHDADLEVISKVQKFLDNVKNVMSVHNAARRKTPESSGMKFTDFIIEVINTVKSYNDSDLKHLFFVLNDESRKYNYRGCKFYELLDNNDMRRFVSRILEDIKKIPLEVLRKHLDGIVDNLENRRFEGDNSKIVKLINALYTGLEKQFVQILDNLNSFRTRRSNGGMTLREILSKGLRSIVFDFYSNLNPNARQHLKSAVQSYWRNRHTDILRLRYNHGVGTTSSPRANFMDLTRFHNSDMHKWSAGAKRNKYVTKSLQRTDKKPNTTTLHKPKSSGLTVNLNSFKPVIQSIFKELAFGNAVNNKRTDNKTLEEEEYFDSNQHDDLYSEYNIQVNTSEAKRVSSEDKRILLEGELGIPKTKMTPFSEFTTHTTKKKLRKRSKNKGKISLENSLKLKSKMGSEVQDVNEIQKRYKLLRKLDENLSPELNSEKGFIKNQEANVFDFLVGGQKIKHRTLVTKRKRGNNKRTTEQEAVTQIVADNNAVIEVTVSTELLPNSHHMPKRLRTPHKTTRKAKQRRKPRKSQLNAMLFSKKSLDSRKAFPPISNEGLSIESFEDSNTNVLAAMRRTGKEIKLKSNKSPNARNDKVVRILYKIEKELKDVKARINNEVTFSPNITSGSNESNESTESTEYHSNQSTTSTTKSLKTEVILSFWSPTKSVTPKSATTKTAVTTTIVTDDDDGNARREVKLYKPLDDALKTRPNKFKYYYDITNLVSTKTTEAFSGSAYNVTSDPNIGPLQKLLNQTMERISSYLNDSNIRNDNSLNSKYLDSLYLNDIFKDESKSDGILERAPKTTNKIVTKTTKASQEVSFKEGQNKMTSDENPKTGYPPFQKPVIRALSNENEKSSQSKSSEENEKGTVSKEKAGKESSKENEKATVSKEKAGKESSKENEKATVSKEKVGKESSEENEKGTVSKEKVGKESLDEKEKGTVSKEKAGKESSDENEKGTVSKGMVEKDSQSSEEVNNRTVSEEKKNDSSSTDEGENNTESKENVEKGSSSLEEAKKTTLKETKIEYLEKRQNSTIAYKEAQEKSTTVTTTVLTRALTTTAFKDIFRLNRTAIFNDLNLGLGDWKDAIGEKTTDMNPMQGLFRRANPAPNHVPGDDPFKDLGFVI